jgi:hypothetical protein
MKGPKKSIRRASPFYIQKALDSNTENVRNATRLKNGTFLVDMFNDKQAETLIKANIIGSHLVHVERQ